MRKTMNTKRALVFSVLSLVLCVSMLAGTTFAWFTDTAVSGSNIIKSGKLDVALLDADGNSLEGQMIEWVTADDRDQDKILWEPNCTYNTEPFTVKNEGNLALKFRVIVNGITGDAKLLEAIDFTCIAKNVTYTVNYGGFDIITTGDVDLLAGGEYVLEPGQSMEGIVLSGHMDANAGNEYQSLTVEGISISVIATQVPFEHDSIDGTYDESAIFGGLATGKLEAGQSAVEIPVKDGTNVNMGSATIPASAIADTNADCAASILPSDYVGNFTIAAGMESQAFNINVSNLKADNTDPVKVKVRIATGLNPATIKLYHYDEEIPCTYDPVDGMVTFESTSFSPFTVVFDAESEYVPTNPAPEDLPEAEVTEYQVTEEIVWGEYGQWSPTEGLEANLDAIFKFTALQNLDEATASPYAQWLCDFYVKLDRDLGENEIFLGGNYGPFGWVGFHNGTTTLDANTEIAMLGSVAGSWTYVDVVQNVGEFICGVGNVGNSLEGATFTVSLRLTNPENAEEFHDVATITHTW